MIGLVDSCMRRRRATHLGQVCREAFNGTSRKQRSKKDWEEECTYSQEATAVKLHPDTNKHRYMHSVTWSQMILQNSTKDLWGRGGGRGGTTVPFFMCVNISKHHHPPGQAEHICKNFGSRGYLGKQTNSLPFLIFCFLVYFIQFLLLRKYRLIWPFRTLFLVPSSLSSWWTRRYL